MADRCNFYFRQMVQEAELDLAFEQLEAADRNLAADIGIFGIVSGAYPVPHEPVPDLTVDLIAPGRSYDRTGRRIFFGTDQSVDCSADYTGVPTEVSTSGNERRLGVFLKFDRLLSDPRTDGNSQQIYFRQDEHFRILVRQGAEAPVGTAQNVSLQEDEILVCDIRRTAGQTQITEEDIDLSRRQAFVFSTGSAVEIESDGWAHISPAVNTVQAALDSVDTVLDEHFDGTNPHKAEQVTFEPVSYVEADNVQSAVSELISKLAGTSSTDTGATRIGTRDLIYLPVGLPAGSVDSHIVGLLSALNGHITRQEDVHPASGISVLDSEKRLSSGTVESALQEILAGFETGHYRPNQVGGGQHRAVRQPVLGSGRVLLFHSRGTGSAYAQLRIFADSTDIWFTVNADWNGSRWVKDVAGTSGGIRLERSNIRFIYHCNSDSLTFDDWPDVWRLAMSALSNSAMTVSGNIREAGRIGMRETNPMSGGATLCGGGTVTFRNRFAEVPSSVSFTQVESSNWSAWPAVARVDRDGFSYYAYQYLNSNVTGWWYGQYTVIS